MRVTADGQVTIPRDLREQLGLGPDTEVEFELDGDGLHLRKIADAPPTRGQMLVAHMRGRLHSRFTTEDLMEFTRGPRTDLENSEACE